MTLPTIKKVVVDDLLPPIPELLLRPCYDDLTPPVPITNKVSVILQNDATVFSMINECYLRQLRLIQEVILREHE